MARFLTTIPSNSGFVNFGTVQSYPTGGTGPTAYGPTSYFGSDPRPAEPGDSLYTAIDLGDFSSPFRTITLRNSHGGLSRRQTTFYKIKLSKTRSIQFTQDFSQFSYERETNRNTLLAFYRIEDDGRRTELPINDQGYVSPVSSIDYNDENLVVEDYPSTILEKGEYLFLITNDIRYLETTYSLSVNINVIDWRFVSESVDDSLEFGAVTATADSILDFGAI
tara:strand:- start:298 stop:963 length:666 start_codon:yes stop_codon:yes gene_type:complete